MQHSKSLLSAAFVAMALLTSCSSGETSESSGESSSAPTSTAATPSISVSSSSSIAASSTPSSTASGNDSNASTGNRSDLLTAVASTGNLSNGAVQKFTAVGSITDLRQNQILILNTRSAPYVAKISLDSGEEEQRIEITDADVPEGYQLTQIDDAAFIGDSIVLKYQANEGADKYNSGNTVYAFAQFSMADGEQLGKTFFTKENPLSPSYGNAPWVAGVPGQSIVLTVPVEQNFSDGAAEEGNIAIFEDGKEPRLQSLQKPGFNQPHAFIDGELVALSSDSKVPGLIASTQVGEDSFIALQNFNHFLVNRAGYTDALSGLESPTPLNRTSLAQTDYVNGYWCGQDNKIYNLVVKEIPDYGDVLCNAVSEDGTVLGRKGDKSLPVLVTKEGVIVDLPSEVRGAKFMSSKYFISGSNIYQYSIEK